jgi:hypothetical protein
MKRAWLAFSCGVFSLLFLGPPGGPPPPPSGSAGAPAATGTSFWAATTFPGHAAGVPGG